ncbi:MAG: hypothetical protein SFV15_11755 [Polyangiaceae bacterium]|nr:hypothetical protein [Polyangiaceae bacterium]
MKTTIALSALFTSLLLPNLSLAEGRFNAEPFIGKKLRLDGLPREWPGKNVALDEKLKGDPGEHEVSAKIGYDKSYLYITLDAEDANLVRTKAAGDGEDHATLYLAIPSARGGYTNHTLRLYPGKAGVTAGLVREGTQAVRGAKLVEAEHDEGFTFEAQIPWEQFPETKNLRVGMRATITYSDADKVGHVRSVVGASKAKAGQALPPMPLESEQALFESLVRSKGLNPNPARTAYGNISGGPALEQVALFGNFLSIVGPDYRLGKQFYFADLGLGSKGRVTRLELHDFDGDGRDEIVLQRRVGSATKYREALQVMTISPDDSPVTKFECEVGIHADDMELDNEVQIIGNPGARRIRISQGTSKNVSPETWNQAPSTELSVLLPWDTVKSRTFGSRDGQIAEVGNEAWKPKMAGPATARPAAAPPEAATPPVEAPRPPSSEELLDRVYGLYRNDRKVGRKKPNFDFVANVAGDARPERVLVHGSDLVVFGKGFLEGKSYAYITIGVADPKDILSVTAQDVTGDKIAEVVVRAQLQAKASKALGGDVVTREALFVYRITGGKLGRIFGAETARSLGKDRVAGKVSFVQQGKRGVIQLLPGRAQGWTEKTYPFPEDRGSAGGLEPLLLPWGERESLRYVFDGERFTSN